MRELPEFIDLDSPHTVKELMELCQQCGIATNRSKDVMIARLRQYLQTGERGRNPKVPIIRVINANTLLERDFEMDAAQRRFFESKVGESFRLLVPLQVWIRNNLGRRSYGDALEVYRGLVSQCKGYSSRDTYLYLCYVRDFFLHNPNLGIREANRCWQQRQEDKYKGSDLAALKS